MTLYNDFLAWMPALTILAFTILFYIGFRIVSIRVIRFILDKLPFDADENIASALYRPGRMAIVVSGGYTALVNSPLARWAQTSFVSNLVPSCMIIAFYWALYNFSSSTSVIFEHFFTKAGKKLDPAISGLFSSFFHALIIFFAVASVLSTWGFNISGFIAGLSIGGLAVSLAAKDSLANIFACLVILMDQPFHVGDWIICNNIEGIVESISFRSTNVRTFTQALVYIPNSLIISTPIQNFTNRDMRRLEMTLGVTYDATREQVQSLVEKITAYLKSDPDILDDGITVAFSELGASSLDISIVCYCRHTSYAKYMKSKEKINLELLKLLEETGTSAAYPSTSVYIEKTGV
ncbi:MAG: mechanosensitive ion channel family protein [Acidaminococcus sp.]|uniref:mechanosensitive ion channel family protein n=1 Tax=Acidaminococcus sp. TaxID=1872103 RepID=UPI003F143284